ncbi:chemotaxis protein CheW, partial [Methylobacterium platani]
MPESAPDRFLVVSLGSGPSAERVALPAGLVRAVAPVPALIRLPGAPPAVSGLAALRGGVVPVLDLARLLAPAAAPFPPGRLVLAEIDGPVGLLVGRVSGPTVDPGPARIIDLPAVVAGLRSGRPLGASVAGSAPRADAGAAGPPVALVALTVAGASYALPLDEVEAVASLPAPLAPDDGDGAAFTVGTMALPGPMAFLGTMPWRGRALPLLSLSVLLGRGPAPGTRVAVVGGVGLVAERVGPVLRLPREAIDPVPRALRAGPAAGFARLDDGR